MSPINNPAIPEGSTILVTGANGFIGSHTADQFLQLGYKVRGTARDTAKSAWVSALFDEKYGKGQFELLPVPEMAAERALDEAVKGVSAVVHVASVMSFDPDPKNVIPVVISGALNALKAAYKEPSVKRFVLTSSSTAALFPVPNVKDIVITQDSWNDTAVKMAWEGAPASPERGGIIYAASKTQSEREVWNFHEENKEKRPDLVVNTVLPNGNMGKSLDLVNQGHPSTSALIVALWHGSNIEKLLQFPPQYFIDVQDTGRLHVAAAIHPDVKDERIFGFADSFNWDKVLDILRKQNPQRKFVENFQSAQDLSVIQPRARAERLLRDLGRPGWTSLEDSLVMNTEDLRATA